MFNKLWQLKIAYAHVVVVLGLCICMASCKQETPPTAGTAPEADSEAAVADIDIQPPTSAPVAPPAVSAEVSLKQAIDHWNNGKKAEAADLFVTTDWKQAATRPPPFGVSETEFAALSQDERQQIQEQIDSFQQMCRYVIERGKTALNSGDKALARKQFQAVHDSAQWLTANPDTLTILLVVGKANKEYATKLLNSAK